MNGWIHDGRRNTAVNRVKDCINELYHAYLRDEIPFSSSVYVTDDRLSLRDAIALPRKPIPEGTQWGANWQSAYFALDVDVPVSFHGRELAVRLNLGGETLVYDATGRPLYGLTSCCVHAPHYLKDIHRIGTHDGSLRLYVETAANDLFGLDRETKKLSRNMVDVKGRWNGVLRYARLGAFDGDVWNLFLAEDFLFQLYQSLDKTSTRAVRLLGALFDAATAYPVHGAKVAYESLAKELAKPAVASALSTVVIGHAHIDTAWLWPIAESHRKVARTFSSQIENLKHYPSYVFGSSSPQHYKWVKEEHPELYADIGKAIQEKRWEPLGAMWVEPDCSLVSGESLVRQILEGRQYFSAEFGVDVRNCWIPDVFGYPASLPQILKKADAPYFLTQKISWSAHTRFPYESFIWEGIDGSSVVTHFLPERTYNSDGTADGLARAEKNFLEKDRLDEFVTALGVGDGGGGPKEEHIERILLAADLEGVPKACFGFVSDFFERLAREKDKLETYKGELYLELHRGTLTSQALTKKQNRIFEEAFRVLEALYAAEDEYPFDTFKSMLHDGLTLQFHDILPGSCIGEAYVEARKMYADIYAGFVGLLREYLDRNHFAWLFCSSSFGTAYRSGSAGKAGFVSLFNFTGNAAPQLIKFNDFLSDGKDYSLDGRYPVVKIGNACYGYVPMEHDGWNSFELVASSVGRAPGTPLVLENAFIRYEFDARGRIVVAYDKATGKDYMGGRSGNILRLYADVPQNWEAWDIDFYYREQELDTISCVDCVNIVDNDVFSVLRAVFHTPSSEILQYVVLPKQGKEVYFITSVEWDEFRKLLRVDFSVDPGVEWAVCDIPYGLFKRKTHVQNEEDFAKFEFCARGFVDVSGQEGGAAIVSDSKYGYSCRNGVLGLSLLRSPVDPDPYADIGHHEFIYAFVPHSGELAESDVRNVSASLNAPDIAVFSSERPSSVDLPVSLSSSDVTLSVIKRSEDGTGLVWRAVENNGRHTKVRLKCAGDLCFHECNLLEAPIGEEGKVYRNDDELTFGPFEIKTFKALI